MHHPNETETPLEKLAREDAQALAKRQRVAQSVARFPKEAITEAIDAQRPMVLSTLKSRGATADFDDVMGDISEHVLNSLPNYEAKGNVPLVRWATGVAKSRLNEHYRQSGKRRAREVSYTEEFAREVITMDTLDDEGDFLKFLLQQVRERVLATPGGIKQWQRLTHMAPQEQRGAAARSELRELLADESGLPVTYFGSEPTEDTAPETVVAHPISRDDGYHVHCTLCGTGADVYEGLLEAARAARGHTH